MHFISFFLPPSPSLPLTQQTTLPSTRNQSSNLAPIFSLKRRYIGFSPPPPPLFLQTGGRRGGGGGKGSCPPIGHHTIYDTPIYEECPWRACFWTQRVYTQLRIHNVGGNMKQR